MTAATRVRPFFFGPEDRRLFGIYDEPAGAAEGSSGMGDRKGVVICPPTGEEYFAAHRALRELARRLARAGHVALRFDYYGTGDSAGESDEDMGGRTEDVIAALEEVRSQSPTMVTLVGLRIGAKLAACAAALDAEIEDLVLWDPVDSRSDEARSNGSLRSDGRDKELLNRILLLTGKSDVHSAVPEEWVASKAHRERYLLSATDRWLVDPDLEKARVPSALLTEIVNWISMPSSTA